MLFRFPLRRRGFYYMSKETYQQIIDEDELEEFHALIKHLNAEVTEKENFLLITIKPQKNETNGI